MAAVTPVAEDGGLGAIKASRQHYVRTGVLATGGTGAFFATGTNVPFRNLKPIIFFFSSLGDGDTWTGAPRGTVAVFWQGQDVDADFVLPYLIQRGGIGVPTIVEFQTTGAAKAGWLLCLCNG